MVGQRVVMPERMKSGLRGECHATGRGRFLSAPRGLIGDAELPAQNHLIDIINMTIIASTRNGLRPGVSLARPFWRFGRSVLSQSVADENLASERFGSFGP